MVSLTCTVFNVIYNYTVSYSFVPVLASQLLIETKHCAGCFQTNRTAAVWKWSPLQEKTRYFSLENTDTQSRTHQLIMHDSSFPVIFISKRSSPAKACHCLQHVIDSSQIDFENKIKKSRQISVPMGHPKQTVINSHSLLQRLGWEGRRGRASSAFPFLSWNFPFFVDPVHKPGSTHTLDTFQTKEKIIATLRWHSFLRSVF